MSAASLRLRREPGGVVVTGAPSCVLGRPLPGPGEDPGGSFVRWDWNGRRLVVENDRFGFVPLFYAAREDEVAISSSLAELVRLGAPTELDEVALAVFRGIGFYLGEDTPLRHVKVLPPGSRLIWDGTLRLETRPLPLGSRLELSRREAERELAERVLRSTERQLCGAGDVALSLSGGLDSRHLLLALIELGRPPRLCVSVRHYPPLAVDDVDVARAVCRRLGLSHVVPPRLPRFEAERRKNLLTHFLADEHAWYVPAGDALRAAEPAAALMGCGGDTLLASTHQTARRLALFREGQLRRLAGLLMDAYSALWDRGRGLPGSPELREAALGRVERELARHEGATHPLTMFAFWNRGRREMALMPHGICEGVPISSPYVDGEVFELAASLPPELTADGTLHLDAVRRAYPWAAELPLAASARSRLTLPHYAAFGVRAGLHAARTDPRRLAELARPFVRAPVWLASARYRRGRALDGPGWLLYRWQLERLTGRELPF